MKCKCKQKEEYWNSIGNDRVGYYKKKDLLLFLFFGAIPIIGQFLLILVLIVTFYRSKTTKIKNKWKYPK